jgi:hypothetical protein
VRSRDVPGGADAQPARRIGLVRSLIHPVMQVLMVTGNSLMKVRFLSLRRRVNVMCLSQRHSNGNQARHWTISFRISGRAWIILSAGPTAVCAPGGGLLREIPVERHGNIFLLNIFAINRSQYKLVGSRLDGVPYLVDTPFL